MSTLRKALIPVVAVVAMAACTGGSSDSGGTPPGPGVGVVEWRTPVASSLVIASGSASAFADTCGGVVVIAVANGTMAAQRFVPASGWQATPPVLPPPLQEAQGAQTLEVAGVPQVVYRDDANWYRRHYDCATNAWSTETLFPVVQGATYPSGPTTGRFVNFSETASHTLLAAWVVEGKVWTRELMTGGWADARAVTPTVPSLSDNSVQEPVLAESVAVARGRDGDAIWMSTGTQTLLAFRSAASDTAQPLRYITCLSDCPVIPSVAPPRVEPDGSITAQQGAMYRSALDWYRVTASGLVSIPGALAPTLPYSSRTQVVRSDGVAQWMTGGYREAKEIYENALKMNWLSPAPCERDAGCDAVDDRVFSLPDTGHLATVLNADGATVKAPLVAISDRSSATEWRGGKVIALGSLQSSVPAGMQMATNPYSVVRYLTTSAGQFVIGKLAVIDGQGRTLAVPFVVPKY